jgi:hypothetical protein
VDANGRFFNPPHPVEDVHILLAGFALAILHRGYRILVDDFDVLMLGGLVRLISPYSRCGVTDLLP